MSAIITKAIITAMPEEAEKIIKKYSLKQIKTFGYTKIYEGERQNNDWENETIILGLCWVGKI